MVGQTLQGRYRYYRCRRAFAGPKHDRCPSVYVRADGLEQAIRTESAKVLADPKLVLAEAERVRKQDVNHIDLAVLESQLTDFENRRGRLLKLYEMGEIDDDYFRRESATIKGAKSKIEE